MHQQTTAVIASLRKLSVVVNTLVSLSRSIHFQFLIQFNGGARVLAIVDKPWSELLGVKKIWEHQQIWNAKIYHWELSETFSAASLSGVGGGMFFVSNILIQTILKFHHFFFGFSGNENFSPVADYLNRSEILTCALQRMLIVVGLMPFPGTFPISAIKFHFNFLT